MRKRVRSVLTLTCLGLLLAAGCAPTQQTTPPSAPQRVEPVVTPPPVPAAPPKVGLLLPLSGNAAALGQDLLDAAQMAIFDVGATELELLPRDTGDGPDQAVRAARSALADGAELLIGPLFARSTRAVAPLAAQAGVSVLSFSNDASVAGPGVYVLGFRPEEQIARVVGYAAGQGLTRIAALAPDDAFGSRSLAAGRAAAARLPGADLAPVQVYSADSDSPTDAVQQLAAGLGAAPTAAEPTVDPLAEPSSAPAPGLAAPLAADALLIADGGPRVTTIAALLSYYGVGPGSLRLLGPMRWQEDPSLLADPALRGAWLASWPPETVRAFADRFAAVYGREPSPLAILAYDATALAAVLAREQPRFTAAQLTDPQGFVGGAGIFRLRPEGVAEHGLAVVEIVDGATLTIDPPPATLADGLVQR